MSKDVWPNVNALQVIPKKLLCVLYICAKSWNREYFQTVLVEKYNIGIVEHFTVKSFLILHDKDKQD